MLHEKLVSLQPSYILMLDHGDGVRSFVPCFASTLRDALLMAEYKHEMNPNARAQMFERYYIPGQIWIQYAPVTKATKPGKWQLCTESKIWLEWNHEEKYAYPRIRN